VLDEIIQKQQRYGAGDRRHDEKNGQQRALVTSPEMATIAVEQLVDEVFRDAELEAANYGKAEAAERGRLKAEISHHDTRLTQELHIERQNAENERQQDLANLDGELGEGSKNYAALAERLRSAEDALTAVKARLTPKRRPLRTHWREAF